jgi:hypothetical protein
MPITSWLIMLSEHEDLRADALAALAADPRLTMGDRLGPGQSVVAETGGPDEDADLWRGWLDLPGVVFADLVWSDFSDLAPGSYDAPMGRQGRHERNP